MIDKLTIEGELHIDECESGYAEPLIYLDNEKNKLESILKAFLNDRAQMISECGNDKANYGKLRITIEKI